MEIFGSGAAVLWILTPNINLKKNIELMNLCKDVKDITIMWIEYNKIQIILNNNHSQLLFEGKAMKPPNCVYFNSYSTKLLNTSINDTKSIYIHKTLCEYFDLNNIPIINTSKTRLHSVDKYALYQLCNKLNIKCPKTCIVHPNQSEICYKNILKNFNFPIILKYPSGSGGNFIWKIDNYNDFIDFISVHNGVLHKLHQPAASPPEIMCKLPISGEHCILIQETILESLGKDIRVCIIGKEIAFAYERINKDKNEFRSNIERGGEGNLKIVDEKLENIVKKIINDLNIEIGGIDFLYGKNEMILCEITLGFPICDKVNSLDDINIISKNKIKNNLINYLVKRTLNMNKDSSP
jgi:glutathione synthase/RimK-type ligase-like ATP-grasp enzyme